MKIVPSLLNLRERAEPAPAGFKAGGVRGKIKERQHNETENIINLSNRLLNSDMQGFCDILMDF